MLSRPVDRFMMVRLQLKHRFKYESEWCDKCIIRSHKKPSRIQTHWNRWNWVELFDLRQIWWKWRAKTTFAPMNADDKQCHVWMKQTDTANEENLIGSTLDDVEDRPQWWCRKCLDDRAICSKYNIGADSCTQPTDFNEFVVFDRNPHRVIPAEKNKLSLLLTDISIEALAFPHSSPDGWGSFNKERLNRLNWKKYCKERLFSSDSRFTSDSSYIVSDNILAIWTSFFKC